MFEVAELGHKLSKKEFEELEPVLHTRLLEIQRSLRNSNFSVIIIVSGVEGAGKGQVVNRLNKWLDTRGITTNAFWDESDEEKDRPEFWKFWRQLPPRGTISIMFGSWYTKPIIEHVFGDLDDSEFETELMKIRDFERTLADDGTLIIKFWYHMSKKDIKDKLRSDTEKAGGDKKLSPILRKFSKHYAQFTKSSERAIRLTDNDESSWHIIEASDKRYRDSTTGQIIHDTILAKIKQTPAEPIPLVENNELMESSDTNGPTILDQVDLDLSLPTKSYDRSLSKLQTKLYNLAWEAHAKKVSAIIVFEGWDASGKGGAIRRLTSAMDARLYRVISVAAPTDEELGHHYLWRFWRNIPRAGYTTIYDRSWYGRVLVERVEGFTQEPVWQRGYHEINEFEQQLHDSNIILCKFWMHISPEEQLRRFKEREQIPWKKHKLTDEDWRNREKWNDYLSAVNDMVSHTSTEYAPWSLIPGNDKQYARIEVLKTVCKQFEQMLS